MSTAEHAPDLLVIDIGLPDADGRDVCQALRARGVETPVLFLTARDALTDRLAGFSAGGDDYVTKPFDIEEVAARLQALLRRAGGDAPASSAGMEFDPTERTVAQDEARLTLTPTEFRLLAALAARQGRACAPPRADTHRVAARRDRARQHARRVHRPAAPEARLAAAAAEDRHRPRHRLPARDDLPTRSAQAPRAVGDRCGGAVAGPLARRLQHRAAPASERGREQRAGLDAPRRNWPLCALPTGNWRCPKCPTPPRPMPRRGRSRAAGSSSGHRADPVTERAAERLAGVPGSRHHRRVPDRQPVVRGPGRVRSDAGWERSSRRCRWRPYESTAQTALVGSAVLGVLVLIVVALAARVLISALARAGRAHDRPGRGVERRGHRSAVRPGTTAR